MATENTALPLTGNDSGLATDASEHILNPVNAPHGNVSVIYARLPVPTMSSSNVDAWFISMDFWFTASGITADKQKTATILAALDPNVIAQLSDVIASMPPNDRYEYIKEKIINHFADSEQRRLNRLLSELPLGDRKPSELFFEMKRVAGSTLGETALKSLWTKRLPEFAQPVVAASAGTPAEFTKIADAIVDAMASNQISSVQAKSASDISELRAAVVELGNKFQRFSVRSDSRSRRAQTPRSHSKNRAPAAYSNNTTGEECWYHKKYGRKAQKCRSPCRHYRRKVNVLATGASTTNQQSH